MRSTTVRSAGMLATIVATLAEPVGAQRIEGHVQWLGWDQPGAATVQLLDSRLLVIDSIIAGEDGVFSFDVRPGTWALQAIAGGEASPLSEGLTLATPADTVRLVLHIASPLFALATQCPAMPDDIPTGVLVGVAFERLARTPLADTRVRLFWSEPGEAEERVAEARTDARGQYRFCGVPAGVPMRMAVVAFGRTTLARDGVQLDPSAVYRQDVSVNAFSEVGAVSSVNVVSSEPIRSADGTARVRGRLFDAVTGGGIAGADVRIEGTPRTALADAQGRFQLDSVPAGMHMVKVSRLGYSEQTVRLDVPKERSLDIEIRLGAEAVQLAGLEVDVRKPFLMGLDERSNRVVAGERLAEYQRRGARFEDIARDRFPLHVTLKRGSLCLESRRVGTFADAECAMVPVYIDDVQIGAAAEYLYTMSADEIESAIYLSPGEAGMRYGLASQALGVLLIYTRGNGPFQNPRRNVR